MTNSTLTAPTSQYTPAPVTTIKTCRSARWWNFNAWNLEHELLKSQYIGRVTYTDNAEDISGEGLFSYEIRTTVPGYDFELLPFVQMTVLREFSSRYHGKLSDYEILGHAIVHLERGTECTAKDPQYWDEECNAVEFESSNRMGFGHHLCNTRDPQNKKWIYYYPTH
ncbi:hypothetical protein [Glutamicibacter sp. NPDC087344]|uniref:hypothetical protein n=1 Tax=Glutamicibacter sp. NPDC087344 TaxID=3363994 RepID=UPI003817B661